MNTKAALIALSLVATSGIAHAAYQSPEPNEVLHCGVEYIQQPNVEVVFVLDTTGSMSGLIAGAKDKIWSIASSIAQAQPSPNVKMGLVGYRDRGDEYITTRTKLTDEIDAVYEKLMGFNAAGGGDGPESVNQALFEAVERFEWSDDPSTLKIVFLVGDAEPHMDYNDDVKYQATCKLASERGIMINTIQCGRMGGTKEHWNKIANLTNGAYASIAQDSGVQRITTPYDSEMRELDQEFASLMITYGTRSEHQAATIRYNRGSSLVARSTPEASADRAMYNQSAAGKANVYGKSELVDQLESGSIEFDDLKKDELPASLQTKTEAELKEVIHVNMERRKEIQSRLAELNTLRKSYQEKALADGPADGFDQQVLRTLQKQGASIGLNFDSKSAPAPKSEEGKKSSKGED
ncbi:MAG: vWA domain-containing protein [Phycisphaerales bacterium]